VDQVLAESSLDPACCSSDSDLQNANRTSDLPSAGFAKKLDPGTEATPAFRARAVANRVSPSSDMSEKSARM
jgi:hypothetical protein